MTGPRHLIPMDMFGPLFHRMLGGCPFIKKNNTRINQHFLGREFLIH